MTERIAPHLERGRRAEQIAAAYLKQRGLRLIVANYQCRHGELDLVLESGSLLVVCEVRYRAHADRSRLADTIDYRKQRRIARTTLHFLQAHRTLAERPVRFDVALISGSLAHPRIDWLTDAFDGDG